MLPPFVPGWIAVAAMAFVSPGAAAADIASDERRSGYEFMSRETRAMQDDDAGNPGMLSVLDGEALWRRAEGPAGKSCETCHGAARTAMNGVAARHPAFDAARGRPVDLEQRINLCRTEHQDATPLPFEGRELLALTVFVAHSRGASRSRLPMIRGPGRLLPPGGRFSSAGRGS